MIFGLADCLQLAYRAQSCCFSRRVLLLCEGTDLRALWNFFRMDQRIYHKDLRKKGFRNTTTWEHIIQVRVPGVPT